MRSWYSTPIGVSARTLAVALTLMCVLAGTASATTDPTAAECQDAMRIFQREERWYADHFDEDLPLGVFDRHEDRMRRAWRTAELGCGIDGDADGVIGRRTGSTAEHGATGRSDNLDNVAQLRVDRS